MNDENKSLIQLYCEVELEIREEIKQKCLDIVYTVARPGYGRIQKGMLTQYVFSQMGFHGRHTNYFGAWMHKIMQEEGFSVSIAKGVRWFSGICLKDDITVVKEIKYDTKKNKGLSRNQIQPPNRN